MATVAVGTASCPTSSQLRFGFRCKKSILVLSLRPPRRRIRLISASAGGAAAREDGGGNSARDGTFSPSAWTSSASSSDPFSGWFDKDSSNPRQRQGFGGGVGAGLAGIFLATGVAFASLSLGKRNFGPKCLEPLKTQHEVMFSSADVNENVTHVENVSNNFPVDDQRMENGLDSEFKTDCNGFDPIPEASDQEDSPFIPRINNTAVVADSKSISTASPKPVKSSSYAFTSTNSNGSTSSDALNPIVKFEKNQSSTEVVDLPPSTSDSKSIATDPSDESFGSWETENSKLPSDSVSTNSSLPSENLKTSKLDADLESQVGSLKTKVVVQTVTSDSSNLEFKLNDAPFSPIEFTGLPPDEHNLTETEPTGTPSASVSEDSYVKELEEHNLTDTVPTGTPSASVSEDSCAKESDRSGFGIKRSRSCSGSRLLENLISYAGVPAPSLVSAALQVPPGKVVVPAAVDQVQGQALSALQVLKVIEADVKPGDICTRREYARWLVSASSVLSRNATSKVYPAMYIENVTELAFDDISPEDLDFPSIQGLAEAGLISSKLSGRDSHQSLDGGSDCVLFSPESPLSRQDLVSWKMVLERKQLPEVDKEILYQCSGFIDIDKINLGAWPAIMADLASGDHGIIALAFGFTRLFHPDKPVTKAQAAIALAIGEAAELVSEELARLEAESMAESAVAAHTALVAQVEKDINASYEKELSIEREKIDAVEKLAAEARLELERLKAEREEENAALLKGRAAMHSEMEVLSRVRCEVEEQLQSLLSDKMEIAFQRDRINKLHQEAENENQVIAKLQYDLEVERKALSMARAWAEDEAKRAREQAKALEEARERWERHGIKVVVDGDLRDDAAGGVSWLNTATQSHIDGTVSRAESLVEKLKIMAGDVGRMSSVVIQRIVQKIMIVISVLNHNVRESMIIARELQETVILKVSRSVEGFQQNAAGVSSTLKDGMKRLAGDCREGMEKITQKFKT